MAEVALPGHPHHHRPTSSIGDMMSTSVTTTEPTFEMVPNPTFSFPMKPVETDPGPQSGSLAGRRRPVSMHLGLSPPTQPAGASSSNNPHRRTTSALPSFSFNAADASGLKEEQTPPKTPDTPEATTPRRGHKRGGSEFVGGDSRFGVNKAISTSPTKSDAPQLPSPTNALPVPQTSGRRGHAHRRSAALSSHDARSIMQPSEPVPRLSSSLPSTPLEHPATAEPEHPVLDRSVSIPVTEAEKSTLDSERDPSPTRPVSRPRVGFSDNVEIIPRPLSTISSETEGSMSTVRGHSLDNSISSIISMGSPSPPSARNHRHSLSTTSMASISEQAPRARSSIEVSKRIEKEGEWLKSKSSGSTIGKTSETSAVSPTLTFASSETSATPRVGHRSRQSVGNNLGFDRRKSEPSMSMRSTVTSRLSALSLQEHVEREAAQLDEARVDRKSSTRRLRDWARAKLHRRSRDMSKVVPEPAPASPDLRPKSEGSVGVPGKVPMSDGDGASEPEPAMAETDLDAVFNEEPSTETGRPYSGYSEPAMQFNTSVFSQPNYSSKDDPDDMPMVDLDAALGPMRTPPMSSTGQRKTLHSAARANIPQSNYLHRRAESAPVLTPFEARNPQQSAMADVFEEEEEDDLPVRPFSQGMPSRSDAGIGISIVDADSSALNFGVEEDLRISQPEWEPERPCTSYGPSSRLSTTLNERRASSIIEQTIEEEVSPIDSPVQQVEIVEDHEEPRASSLTKSSESSDTPTLLGRQSESLPLPGNASSVMTPETYQTSTFSSPDFARRQGSFDTSRLGTSASSITDNRTTSSCATGEPPHDLRESVDDVPSLTSSRSTMLSTMHANTSRRELTAGPRTSSLSNALDPEVAATRRSKRASIQSLSQLVGGSFERKSKPSVDVRPNTAHAGDEQKPAKKEHRLKKLMFWKSKQSSSTGRSSSSSVPNKLHKERNTSRS